MFEGGTAIMFWTVFGVLVLAPLVGIWRNVGALSMIVAERVAMDTRRPSTVQRSSSAPCAAFQPSF